MSRNHQQQDVGKVLECQTLEVPITDMRTGIEFDVNGVPYSNPPAVQSNNVAIKTEADEKSVFPAYHCVNSNANPVGIHVGSNQEFPPVHYSVGQRWQGASIDPNMRVVSSPQYLTQRGHKVSDHLCWSILVMIFCCWPMGLFAVTKSGEARRLVEMGNYEEAAPQASSAKTWIIASLIIGILCNCIIGVCCFYGLYKFN